MDVDLSYGQKEGPKYGSMYPLAGVSMNVLYNVASGTPFTSTNVYDEVNQLNLAVQPTGPLNSRTGPTTQSLDFKVTKGFSLMNADLSAYVWVLNTFNTTNALNVYSGTGSPYTDSYLDTDAGRSVAQKLVDEGIDPQTAYKLALQGSAIFSIPRTIRFGLRLGF